MNPFSPYPKPFTNPPITGFQPNRNQIHLPIPRNDNSNNSPQFNPLGFQPTQLPDSTLPQRCPPSHDPYPNKRIRHSQDSYTEVFQEGSTPSSQARTGAKLEETRQSPGNIKGLDQGFSSMSPGFRKVQNNYTFGMQENSGGQSNPIFREAMNMMLLRQYFSRSRKDALSRENAQSPTQPTFQNEPAYSMLGNTLNLASLLPNNLNLSNPSNVEFIRQLDQYSTFLQYQQHLVNQQLLYNLQDSSAKGNLNLRNSNVDANSPLMRIPPFSGQNILEYMTASPLGANSINALLRSEIRDKTILNETNLEDELKRLTSNQAIETSNRHLKTMEGRPQEDLKENRPPETKFELNDLKVKQENVCNNIVLQSIGDSKVSNITGSPHDMQRNQKRKASLIQKEIGTVSESKRDMALRKKNKWQMMIDTNEEESDEGSPAVGSYNKVRMSTKSDQSTKPNLRVSSAFRKLSNNANKAYEESLEKMRSKKSRYESSSHRKKKAMKTAAKMKSESESLQNKLNAILEGKGNFENMDNGNQISIASSFGRGPEEFVLDEKDQHVVETRVGKEFQARDLELDLNPASLAALKRMVNLVWDPEYFEREVLEGYFAKLQSILSCTEVNEEKAIRLLIKKNMVQEEVIVTIKKNEKFYSSFLGASHTQKNSKNKKNGEDRK